MNQTGYLFTEKGRSMKDIWGIKLIDEKGNYRDICAIMYDNEDEVNKEVERRNKEEKSGYWKWDYELFFLKETN